MNLLKFGLLVQYSSKKYFFWKDLINFQYWKMTLKIRILRCSRRLFIILVSLTVTFFSEKMLISIRCLRGFMYNSIKKSWKVSNHHPTYTINVMALCGSTYVLLVAKLDMRARTFNFSRVISLNWNHLRNDID